MAFRSARFHDYVSLIRNQSFVGYRVQVQREDFPSVSRYFSLARYGSMDAAYAAALAFRQTLQVPRPGCGGHVKDCRNLSGHVGVTLACETRPGRPMSWAWTATWFENGRQHRRRFSVLRYGYEGAFRLARLEREHRCGPMGQVEPAPPPPELVEWLLRAQG